MKMKGKKLFYYILRTHIINTRNPSLQCTYVCLQQPTITKSTHMSRLTSLQGTFYVPCFVCLHSCMKDDDNDD